MTLQLARSRRTVSIATLTASLVCGCTIEDGPKQPDTPIGRASAPAPSPIPDKSLRPGPQVDDPVTVVRGMPAGVLRNDTASTLAEVDSTPASRATESDLVILRRQLMVPVAGVAVTALSDSYAEVRGGTRPHEALDILAARGTPVLSATSGRVLKLFNSTPGGLMVYAADSSERFILMYAHLDAYAPGLAEGQTLQRGQQIGIVGTTGNAPAAVPHLHFAIARSTDVKQWWKGSPVNPYPLLKP